MEFLEFFKPNLYLLAIATIIALGYGIYHYFEYRKVDDQIQKITDLNYRN